MQSETRIASPKARKYLAQLCKHFAHKVEVDWSEAEGHVDFGPGICDMAATEDELHLVCRSDTEEGLARVIFIVDDHVKRFAWREEPKVDWSQTG